MKKEMLKNIVKNLEPSSTLKINENSKRLEDKGKKIFNSITSFNYCALILVIIHH